MGLSKIVVNKGIQGMALVGGQSEFKKDHIKILTAIIKTLHVRYCDMGSGILTATQVASLTKWRARMDSFDGYTKFHLFQKCLLCPFSGICFLLKHICNLYFIQDPVEHKGMGIQWYITKIYQDIINLLFVFPILYWYLSKFVT